MIDFWLFCVCRDEGIRISVVLLFEVCDEGKKEVRGMKRSKGMILEENQ